MCENMNAQSIELSKRTLPHPYENSLEDEPNQPISKTAAEIMRERRDTFQKIIDEAVNQNLNEFRNHLRELAGKCGYIAGDIDVYVHPTHDVIINETPFHFSFCADKYEILKDAVLYEITDNMGEDFADGVGEILQEEGFGIVYPSVGCISHYRLDV